MRTEPDLFIFCSELSPLLRVTGKPIDLDEEAAFWYLSFGSPTPGRTLVRGVERLPAAHLISWTPGNAAFEQRYWTPLQLDSAATDSPQLLDAIQGALDRSIAEYCSVESSQGVFLSGGTDSTYLATTAASLNGVKLTAFTSAFENELGINDDVGYASEVAAALGMDHRVVPLHAGDALKILEEEVLLADEPCAAWASMTHFKLLATAKDSGVGRMLSGLGADEIFSGYENFHFHYKRYLEFCAQHNVAPHTDGFDLLLLQADSVMKPVLYGGITRLFSDHVILDKFLEPYRSWQYTPYLRAFYRECRRIKPEANPIEMMVNHECQHRIPEMLMANFEPISRRTGIGVNYPWLDPDVVELAAGLDVLGRYRTPAGEWSPHIQDLVPGFKHTLMQVYERKVPEKILRRPIKTFTAPFREWFAKPEFAAPLITRVRASRFWERNIVKPEWLDVLDFPPGELKSNFPYFQFWGLITLTAWYDKFIDSAA
jgi:asparagine synthetase B (glutamine-hydrolysing)